MLTMEGHQAAGSEVEPFEWVSEPVEVSNRVVACVYYPQSYTRIDDVDLIDSEGVVIAYVQVGNVMLLAFVKRHPIADPGRCVTVWLEPETHTLLDQPPTRKATIRIRGVRVKHGESRFK